MLLLICQSLTSLHHHQPHCCLSPSILSSACSRCNDLSSDVKTIATKRTLPNLALSNNWHQRQKSPYPPAPHSSIINSGNYFQLWSSVTEKLVTQCIPQSLPLLSGHLVVLSNATAPDNHYLLLSLYSIGTKRKMVSLNIPYITNRFSH